MALAQVQAQVQAQIQAQVLVLARVAFVETTPRVARAKHAS